MNCPSGYDCTITQNNPEMGIAIVVATAVVLVAIIVALVLYYWKRL